MLSVGTACKRFDKSIVHTVMDDRTASSHEPCEIAAMRGHDMPALQLCPPHRFRSALKVVLAHLNTSLDWLGQHQLTETAILQNYHSRFEGTRCLQRPGPPAWNLRSSRNDEKDDYGRVVLNIGDGTTGTSWLSCVMRVLGAAAEHWNSKASTCGTDLPHFANSTSVDKTRHHAANTLLPSCPTHCERHWAGHEFVSDSPVPQQLAAILATLPHRRVAAIIHTLREPYAWQASRLAHHAVEHRRSVNAWRLSNGGCVLANGSNPMSSLGHWHHAVPFSRDRMALDKLTYDGFAGCLAARYLRHARGDVDDGRESPPAAARDDLASGTDEVKDAAAMEAIETMLTVNVFGESQASVAHRLWRLLRDRWVFDVSVHPQHVLTEQHVLTASAHCRRLDANQQTYQPRLDPFSDPPIGALWGGKPPSPKG